jgi:hypothetical protein
MPVRMRWAGMGYEYEGGGLRYELYFLSFYKER